MPVSQDSFPARSRRRGSNAPASCCSRSDRSTSIRHGNAGASVTAEGTLLEVSGDLGQILTVVIKDSDAMFYNRDSELEARYGFSGLDAMFAWWSALKEFGKDMTRQKLFKEANLVSSVTKRGVEVGFNFFNIKPESAFSRAGILSFALAFYVIYTLWWGFAILFLFEGLGLEMKAGSRREH